MGNIIDRLRRARANRYDYKYWDNNHTNGLGADERNNGYVTPEYLKALAMAESSDGLNPRGDFNASHGLYHIQSDAVDDANTWRRIEGKGKLKPFYVRRGRTNLNDDRDDPDKARNIVIDYNNRYLQNYLNKNNDRDVKIDYRIMANMHNGGHSGYTFSNSMYAPPKIVYRKGKPIKVYTPKANVLNHWNNVAKALIAQTPQPGLGNLSDKHPVIEAQKNQATRNWVKDSKGNWTFSPVK